MPLHRIAHKRHAERPLAERREVDGGFGFRMVEVGREVAEVDLWIDIDRIIARLGYKALQSKKGVSRYLDGCVEVRVVNRRQERKP